MSDLSLIYAGGTFGCHGTPLSALPAHDFLPAFTHALNQPITILDNPIVKDSSTLTPSDLVHFYKLILNAHKNGADKFLLITGTDTLAFLAGFLAIGLQSLPLTLVVTGSMLPFFEPTTSPLTKDKQSDAWENLLAGLAFFDKGIKGSFVSFYGQIYHATSVQKIHKTDKNAFTGISFEVNYPSPPIPSTTPINTDFGQIYNYYCTPNSPDMLADYLEFLANKPATAVIVQGFGAGNMPSSDRLIRAIEQLNQQGFLLIMTSSAIFGQISTAYQAGAWQYQHGFVSGGTLTLPAIYGYALWLCLTLPIHARKDAWLTIFSEKNP